MKWNFKLSCSLHNSTGIIFPLLLTLMVSLNSSAQKTASYAPPSSYKVMPGSKQVTRPIPNISGSTRSVSNCDTGALLDYNLYNEVYAGVKGITYNGSWYGTGTITPYAHQLSSLLNRFESDSFRSYSYAGVVYDSLAFATYGSTSTTAYPYASSTVNFDSLIFMGSVSGDSTKMASDSLIFTVYGITSGTASVIKSIVYTGYSQLKQFYLPKGYLAPFRIPVKQQLTLGESFAVRVDFVNKDTSGHFMLSYSYADSCGSIVYLGNTYNSPAYPSPFVGNSFWGFMKDTLTSSVIVTAENSGFAYNLPGVATNCTFVYPQNWEMIPIINFCEASSAIAPSVVTTAASGITSTSATLNGTVNANGTSSTTSFQWGTSISYTGGTVTASPSPVTGNTTTAISYNLSALTPNTTYHFRAVGINTGGTNNGVDLTFTTSAASLGSTCDTLFNLVSAIDTPKIYLADTGTAAGYLSGNNKFGDLIKAEQFTASAAGFHATGANLAFGVCTVNAGDSNKTVTVKVWDNTGTAGAPGNAIDSATLTFKQIAAAVTSTFTLGSLSPVHVSFNAQAAFPGTTFYVGVVLPTTPGDTVALFTNSIPYGPDGKGWEAYDPGTGLKWASYNTDWQLTSGSLGNYILAEICTPQSTSPCTPNSGVTSGLSPAPAAVPCVVKTQAFSQTYTFVIPASVTFAGTTIPITSVTIDSIGNLPSNLSWAASTTPATYAGGTTGCYIVSGTTSAPCGEYRTSVYVTVVTAAITLHGNFDSLAIQYGIAGVPEEFLQVISSGGTCPTVNTNQSALFVANPGCGLNSPPAVTINNVTNVNCFGQSTGSATAVATGGNGTYTYLWSNNATTATISNVAAGTYTVTVTSNSQTASATINITQPASALSVAPTATPTSCAANTGTASANASGGTSTYTYHWSNNQTTANLTGLAAATYSVTVTDSKSCSVTGSAVVSPPTGFTVSVSTTNVNCYGQNTGSATANVTGASGSPSYAWSNFGTVSSISNLIAGSYSVTVTDANSCTASASASVTQPASALSASTSTTQTSCTGNTGSATVTATGGTIAYSYLWSTNATGTSITNVGVGNYTVTVTDSKTCTATAVASVNTSATFSLNVSSTNVNCFGQSTGTATASVTGGTGNITYLWNNSATSQAISGLGAGNYGVTVADASGCSKAGSTTITQPSSAVSASAVATQTACSSNTGTISVTTSGGTPNYTYAWSNSSTSNPVSGLGVGTLTGTVTDSKGCSVTVSGTVSLPPTFSVSVNATTITCFGQSTGSATAAVTGSGSFTYFWSNGGSSSTISNVPANQYTVTVTDGFGCTQTANGTVSQPSNGVSASTSSTQTSCTSNSGTATVTANGGQSPYTYSWSNAATTSTISNLAAGNYNVTVTDHGGCTVTAVASVNSPATFTLTIDTVGVQCHGASTGSVSANVSGGTPPLSYNWSNGVTTSSNAQVPAGTYNVTVTDGNGCSKAASGVVTQPANALVANATATSSTCGTASGTATVTVVGGTGNPSYLWSNNATTNSISGLGVAVYTVTVTEGNCTASSSAIVNNLNGPSVSILPTNPTCPGGTDGSAVAVPSGGTPGYTYTWTGGATGSTITGKGAGTYTVIVQDATQCQATNTVTLTAPPAITFNPNITNENCAGQQTGSIVLSVGGGTGPYTYLWSNSTTGSSITNLGAGNYSVTVTDFKQCPAVTTLTVSAPTALSVTTSTTNATTASNGTASANVTGGTVPYLYNWNNSQSTSTATGLAQGQYTVTVTDSKGCSATALASVLFTSIEDISNGISSVSLVPNPANDVVKVVVEVETAQSINFNIFDITGKHIYNAHEATSQGKLTHEINVSEFASGIYLVEIAAGNQMIRKRLVVTR